MRLLELLCSFAFRSGVFYSSVEKRESFYTVRGGGAALLLSSIERGAQRFVGQAIRRANDSNLEWSDTGVFE